MRSAATRDDAAGAPQLAELRQDDVALVAALRRRDHDAWSRLVDRFTPDVERLVAGVMGVDADLADIVQDVFVRVLEGAHRIREPSALRGWIASVAVFTARGHIRRRQRWRWLRFFAPADLPEPPAAAAGQEGYLLLRATYQVLDSLQADQRVAFTLRFVAEMELTEVAAACGVSLATIKRRLNRAEAAFLAGAERDPLLRERIERGGRWKSL